MRKLRMIDAPKKIGVMKVDEEEEVEGGVEVEDAATMEEVVVEAEEEILLAAVAVEAKLLSN